MIKLIILFFEFFKIGLFSVGGGLATLPFLYDLCNTHPDWLSRSQLLDMVAVSESTPGALGINMATYVGYIVAKLPGAIITTLGLVVPSIIVIVTIAKFLDKFKGNPTVDKVFYGIRPASIGLIAAAGYLVIVESLLDVEAFSSGGIMDLFKFKSIIFAVLLYVGMIKIKIHPIWFILISAIVGNIVVF